MNDFIEIMPAINDQIRINHWIAEDEFTTLYKGKPEPTAVREVLDGILKEYPDMRVRTQCQSQSYMHIFRIREDGEVKRAFAKTQNECPNAFYNRKVYDSANPNATVSFDTHTI